MSAFRALTKFDTRPRQPVNRVATDAMERGPPSRLLVAPIIAPIVIDPEADEEHPHQDAVDQRSRGEIEHSR